MSFSKLSDYCQRIAHEFYEAGRWCDGKPFISDLKGFLFNIGDFFKLMDYEFRALGLWYDSVGRGLMDRLMTSALGSEITNLFGGWESFRNNPALFILRQLITAWELEPEAIANPTTFMWACILKLSPDIYNFLHYTIYHFQEFWDDPVRFILRQIILLWGLEPEAIAGPETFMWACILKLSPQIYSFLHDSLPIVEWFFYDPKDAIRMLLGELLGLDPWEAQFPERCVDFLLIKIWPPWERQRHDTGRFITEEVFTWVETHFPDLFERVGNIALEILVLLLEA